MRKLIVCGVGLVAALVLAVPGAFGGSSETGITPKTITIGATLPLTGTAAAYAPIVLGLKTYVTWVNARRGPDGKRGINGRQIIYKIYDDGYNPANTIQLTRRLVEQDKVFAVVGQLGTEPVQAARRVPQRAEGAAGARCHRSLVLGNAVQGVPVDDWLPARLHRRGSAVRAPHQGEPAREEDCGAIPERRLRQGLPLRPPRRARQVVRGRKHRR